MAIVKKIFWYILFISFVCQLFIGYYLLFGNIFSYHFIVDYCFSIGILCSLLFEVWIIFNFLRPSMNKKHFHIAIIFFVINIIFGLLLMGLFGVD